MLQKMFLKVYVCYGFKIKYEKRWWTLTKCGLYSFPIALKWGMTVRHLGSLPTLRNVLGRRALSVFSLMSKASIYLASTSLSKTNIYLASTSLPLCTGWDIGSTPIESQLPTGKFHREKFASIYTDFISNSLVPFLISQIAQIMQKEKKKSKLFLT